MTVEDRALVDRFLDMMAAEAGASRNTLAAYRNDLFVAEFGSNPGLTIAGHDVVRVELNAAGTAVVRQSRFMIGITPLDVTFDRAGNLYVADFTGVILKVSRLR